MTISGSGLNMNFNPTPTIFERETQGQKDLQNQADMGRGNVVIVPQSQQDLIPFTHLSDRFTWNYKSEADTPTLVPLGQLRGSGAESSSKGLDLGEEYELLLKNLPEGILDGPPNHFTETLKEVLKLGAEGIAWQKSAEAHLEKDTSLKRTEQTLSFPKYALSNALELQKELTEKASSLLEEMGPNDPSYLATKEFIGNLQDLLKEVKRS